jgi:hypothetical protein
VNWEKLGNRVLHKNCFFGNSGCNWGGLGVSGGSARSIRNFSLELLQDLVLLDVRKSTFQHLTVNWNLNVLEMAIKTFHIVQGLSMTPLLFIPRYLTNIYVKHIFGKNKKQSRIDNLKIWKSENPGSLTGAQAWISYFNSTHWLGEARR